MQEIILRNIEQDYRSSEAYKTLRTNIEFAGSDKKVIMFTSCTPDEGKSTVSLSLALAFAETGKKVLFMDADMRGSVLVGRHNVRGEIKGLSHFLSGREELKNIIVKTQEDGLFMIFAGVVPPNPAELLGNRRMEALIEGARKVYDYVIIDAPPLGSVIDGAVIAKNYDASVLVFEVNLISRRLAKNVKEQLEKSGCPILGAVLNKVDMKQNKYYGKYYGDYYGQYGKHRDYKRK